MPKNLTFQQQLNPKMLQLRHCHLSRKHLPSQELYGSIDELTSCCAPNSSHIIARMIVFVAPAKPRRMLKTTIVCSDMSRPLAATNSSELMLIARPKKYQGSRPCKSDNRPTIGDMMLDMTIMTASKKPTLISHKQSVLLLCYRFGHTDIVPCEDTILDRLPER